MGEGYYVSYPEDGHIIINYSYTITEPETNFSEFIKHEFQVIPETIGQFTELCDKNGKKIFEGDICKDSENRSFVVGWCEKFASFILDNKKWMFHHWFVETCSPECVEIIGNIHDNPELLNK